MRKMIFPFVLCLVLGPVLGCAPVDPKDVNGGINGRLTLPRENLNVASGTTPPLPNTFYAQTQGTASSVVKEFYFTTPPHLVNYQLRQNTVEGVSCDSTPVGQYYLIDQNEGYLTVQANTTYSLNPSTSYRLQFRADNLNCYAIHVSFIFSQF